MRPIDILCAARARIADPARWTQGACARDDEGEACVSVSTHARSWCAVGAISYEGELAYARMGLEGSSIALQMLRTLIGDDVMNWNDAPERTHAEVIAAFDQAIADLGESP